MCFDMYAMRLSSVDDTDSTVQQECSDLWCERIVLCPRYENPKNNRELIKPGPDPKNKRLLVIWLWTLHNLASVRIANEDSA